MTGGATMTGGEAYSLEILKRTPNRYKNLDCG